MTPRRGSRKASVYEHRQDPEAALAHGLSLGLKAGTIKSWLAKWGKSSPATSATAPAPGKVRIFDDWSGVMVKAGPEQSLVRVTKGNPSLVGQILVFINRDIRS